MFEPEGKRDKGGCGEAIQRSGWKAQGRFEEKVLVQWKGWSAQGMINQKQVVQRCEKTWQDWCPYIKTVMNMTENSFFNADIKKNKNFKKDSLPKEGQEYIESFKIISREQFQEQTKKIANELSKITNDYTCIVSEPGKSNFWLTALVLMLVMNNKQKPPKRIVSVPTKENIAFKQVSDIGLNFNDAEDIVFIDDGSYSGSQFTKLIEKVMGKSKNKIHIGLVAISNKAKNKIQNINNNINWLNTPITIDEFDSNKLVETAKIVENNLQSARNKEYAAPDGNYLSCFFYKIPDYASVRYDLLVKYNYKTEEGPALLGYTEGKGTVYKDKYNKIKIYMVGATEPYKIMATLDPEELGLDETGNEESQVNNTGKFSMSGKK